MILSKDDFEKLIEHMNAAFNMDEEHKFCRLLPKLYFKENQHMMHFGIKKDDNIIASVGLYDEEFISKYGTLKVGVVGAVCTDFNERGKDYMHQCFQEMLDYSANNGYDLLLLTGDRIRYSHYGFDDAGRALYVTITPRCLYRLKAKQYTLKEVKEDDYDYLNVMEKMYKDNDIYVNRYSFYKSLRSWNSTPYVIICDDKVVGYFTIKENRLINECFYLKEYEDTVFKAALDNRSIVDIRLPYSFYNTDLILKVGYYNIVNDAKFKILNREKVIKFLGGKHDDGYNMYEILGSINKPSNYKLSFYSSNNDQG